MASEPWRGEPSSPTGPGIKRSPYVDLIYRVHRYVVPRTYAEIGVATGRTLALALPKTVAVGIDPAPQISFPLGSNAKVFKMTSDDFFEHQDVDAIFGHQPIDLAFIDGMHHFEFALRDFMNVERFSSNESVVLVHDCLPFNEKMQRRERETGLWTGDVWRFILCLKEHRPDLHVSVVDAKPTGLGVIRGLDRSSNVLAEHYDEIVEQYMKLPYEYLSEKGTAQALGVIPNDWAVIAGSLPRAQRPGLSISSQRSWLALREASRSKLQTVKKAGSRLKRSVSSGS
jgi:Methyltransferase domain